MPRKLFIYVGAHKTGSTYLHRELVKLDAQLANFDCRYDPEGVKYAKILLARGYPTDELTLAKLRHEIDLSHSKWTESNILLISEHFMGNPYTGYADAAIIARQIARLFPHVEVNILLSVRRQDHFIESWYNQSIKEGGFWTFAEFMQQVSWTRFDWNRLAGDYEAVFGRDHVRVVAYEQMYKEPSAIIDAHFKGWAYAGSIKPRNQEVVNPSLSPSVIEMSRQANAVLGSGGKTELRRILEACAAKPNGKGFGFLSPEERERVLATFAEGNQALATRHPASGIQHYPDKTDDRPVLPDLPTTGPTRLQDFDSIALEVLHLVFKHAETRIDAATTRADLAESKLRSTSQDNARLRNAASNHARTIQALRTLAKDAASEIQVHTRRFPDILLPGICLRRKLRVIRDLLRQRSSMEHTAALTAPKPAPATAAPSGPKPASVAAPAAVTAPTPPAPAKPSPAPSPAISAAAPAPAKPEKTAKAAKPIARLSNPCLDRELPPVKALLKEWKKLPPDEREERWLASRRDVFRQSGEAARIESLKNIHAGRRCFVLGNGPSLKSQDLSFLKNEITFVSNWFVNADDYRTVDPTYYCVSSHEMFGGWNKPDPQLNADYYAKMQERAKASTKFFSFAFRDYLKEAGMFPGEQVYTLLFERPKKVVDEAGDLNFDLSRHLLDGYTVIQTMCIPLAAHFGCKEIILLGCDCDYGIQNASDPKKYFYDSSLHKTATSKFESLQRIWAENGPVFRSYEICRDKLAARGIALKNATAGGRLEVLPRVNYESLFK